MGRLAEKLNPNLTSPSAMQYVGRSGVKRSATEPYSSEDVLSGMINVHLAF